MFYYVHRTILSGQEPECYWRSGLTDCLNGSIKKFSYEEIVLIMHAHMSQQYVQNIKNTFREYVNWFISVLTKRYNNGSNNIIKLYYLTTTQHPHKSTNCTRSVFRWIKFAISWLKRTINLWTIFLCNSDLCLVKSRST